MWVVVQLGFNDGLQALHRQLREEDAAAQPAAAALAEATQEAATREAQGQRRAEEQALRASKRDALLRAELQRPPARKQQDRVGKTNETSLIPSLHSCFWISSLLSLTGCSTNKGRGKGHQHKGCCKAQGVLKHKGCGQLT